MKTFAALLVSCLFASPALADKRLRLDASLGTGTAGLDDYRPALAAGAGIGGRAGDGPVSLGVRGAAFMGDSQSVYVGGLAVEGRFSGTSIAGTMGLGLLRRPHGYFGPDDSWTMTVHTSSALAVDVRIAQLVWKQVEVSVEAMTGRFETIHLDLADEERVYAASACVGYRFY